MNIETTAGSPAKKLSIPKRGAQFWWGLTNGQRVFLIINLLSIGFCLWYEVLITLNLIWAFNYLPKPDMDWLDIICLYVPPLVLGYFLFIKKISLIEIKTTLFIVVLSILPLVAAGAILFLSFFSFFESIKASKF
jgi:hypothetical protein